MLPRRPLPRLLGASAIALLPFSAAAQDAPSLWDLLKPEYIVQRMVQSGIMALRTQVDLKYGEMSVDLAAGHLNLTDITLWPVFQWDAEGACSISFDRLTIRAAPLNRPDLIRLKVQAQGASAPEACFPAEARQAFAMAQIDSLRVPRLTVDLEYDIAQAEADIHAYTQLDGVAALDVTADFSYLWFDGSKDMENPEPVAYLRRAALTVENLGGYEAVKGMIPPPFTDPAQAPAILEGMIGGALASMNRDAAPADATGDPSALNEAQTAFVASAKAVWPAFLQNPGRIVLETGAAPGDDIYLDILSYEDNPAQAFSDMRPRLALAPATARATLPVALIEQALAETPNDLSTDDRRRVGIALATGVGAPRNVPLGTRILTALAQDGDAVAAQELSAALELRQPSEAYRWALVAGAAGRSGAAARLDRLERVLPFAEVLALQDDVLGDVQHPLEALQRIASMRNEAMFRLSGIGRVRSYGVAALWATMGAAAGDGESLDILRQIDERVRRADPEGRAAWAEAEAAASDLAMQAWMGQNLPARFSGQ
ncbi:hypothetical protein [Oceaniglobus trochenteri]|uniref:hypothetical protein n=1 Tax=Oceaniglobus trochenteri TaxID=2763260 RepID=UPI001D00135F|nr:hypothetical protein [Oceaniglobus trochenteri]